jgi:hypothetical protein
MSDCIMSPRTTKQFWDYVDILSISILPCVSVYKVTEAGNLFVQLLDDFHLTKQQVEQFIWIYTSKRKVRAILKLTNGSYMYLKMIHSHDNHPMAKLYVSSSLDLLERSMSNATFDSYRRKLKASTRKRTICDDESSRL